MVNVYEKNGCATVIFEKERYFDASGLSKVKTPMDIRKWHDNYYICDKTVFGNEPIEYELSYSALHVFSLCAG